ncbi:MAG TPA: 30S ribosomal protein S20 [Perlabentimonas sp.]|jgi:small subunit ribosomal protein S20|nr:30S ribosomal protein S20 [Bacteroidales bacterium]MDD4672031.1 30S ribosomal protein S20 [Bacteroidales bacterium]MDY0347628.1 30S ribosomal protein S20 [Tenuifilaceae bacterium]HZJ73487.1 30S ribosomal protein S20 [Perlabentimonas sp.]
MANHKSALKRVRHSGTVRLQNRYAARTTRNAYKILKETTDKEAASEMLPKVTSMLDKLSKRNIIHKNKAANLKRSISLHVNSL